MPPLAPPLSPALVQTETLSHESLPKTSSKKIYNGNMGESGRSLLNETCSFTFFVEDNEGLRKETLNTLEKLRDTLQQNLPQELGLPLLKNENKKVANRKRQEGQSINLSRHKTINILNSPPYRIENVKIFSQIVLA